MLLAVWIGAVMDVMDTDIEKRPSLKAKGVVGIWARQGTDS